MSSHQLNSNNRYSFVFEDYFSLGIEIFFVVFCYGWQHIRVVLPDGT